MKKILLFMLLFVNLQIVIKEHAFMFKAGADVMAQHMYQEPGDNCYDKEIGWYRSPLSNCKYPAVSVRGGGGSSVEFVQNPNTDEETDDDSVVKKTGTEGKKGEEKKEKTKTIDKDVKPDKKVVEVFLRPVKITLPPKPNVPKYVPVHRLAAIMAALGYSGDAENFLKELNNNGWYIADDEAKKLGLNLHDLTGLDAMLLKSNDGESYVLVFAGTNITSVADIATDLQQFFEGKAPQYASALSLALKLNDLLADKNLTFIGHSLGGGLATLASLMTGRYAITFNPAALNNLMACGVFAERLLTGNKFDTSKIYNYVMQGTDWQKTDPLQIINMHPNTTIGFYIGERVNVTNYTGGSGHSINTMVDNFPVDGILYERVYR
ncbi:MAG: hypothetical protein IKQ72_10375 [Bacteroidaceae bacterium]|nr:hypothetical protein [Bacteroidaceae bacterium]